MKLQVLCCCILIRPLVPLCLITCKPDILTIRGRGSNNNETAEPSNVNNRSDPYRSVVPPVATTKPPGEEEEAASPWAEEEVLHPQAEGVVGELRWRIAG